MSKKLLITGVLALCTLVPAYADDSFVSNDSKCDNDTLGSTESAELVAMWTPNEYLVTYSCGTGTGTPPAATNATYGSDFTFATNSCSKTGYGFNLWSCTGGLGERAASSVYNWAITEAVTCTALWTPNTINIDWDPANGAAHTQNTCEYDGAITLPAQPTRTGYTFNGWTVKTTNP